MTQAVMQDITDSARVPKSAADWRPIIGQIAEEVAAERLGAERQSTDGRKNYCTDLIDRHGINYEVKSVGASGNVILYSSRLIKDRHHSLSHPLVYVLVVHRFRVTPEMTVPEARRFLRYSRVWAVPFCFVDGIVQTEKWRLMNRRYIEGHGGCRGCYERGGYLIRASKLIAHGIPVYSRQEQLLPSR